MQYRILGKTKISVSEIGFGAWAIGGSMWGGAKDEESLKALRMALDCGVNFIDTAASYGDGHSEQLIAKIRSSSVGKITIATKIPPKNWQWPAKSNSRISEIFPRKWIRDQTENSLRNLKTDCIDLQQLHVWSASWAHETDWLEEFFRLKKEGKIRHFGISLNDHDPDSALEIVKAGVIDSVQVVYNIFDQSPEDQLFSAAGKNNVGIIVRVPLDEGSLTGKFTTETKFPQGDFRQWYFSPEILPQVISRVEKIKKTFENEAPSNKIPSNETPSLAQSALQFCLSHPAVSTVIAGMRNARQVKENTDASTGIPLPAKLLQTLKIHRWIRK